MSRILVGYDICDAGRRRWAMQQLRTLTGHYQRSFFDCALKPPETMALWQKLTAALDPAEDGLVMAWPIPRCQFAFGRCWAESEQGLYLVL